MDAEVFLRSLAIVLCVAAATTVLFQRLRQPVVLGYILAGMLVGPHVPVPLIADRQIVHTLGELGVVLLMFSIGLELSLRTLARLGGRSLLLALIEVGLTFGLGFMGGRLAGWDGTSSLFAGATLSISSTTIVAKVFAERAVTGTLREVVFGALIAEDLLAVLLLTCFTAIGAGAGLSAEALGTMLMKLIGFLVGLVVIGLLVVPPIMRLVLSIDRPETTLIGATGLCFGVAVLAQRFGYSVALGAFLAGALIAEAGHAHRVAPGIEPLRDLFTAIFFVAVGMQIDPMVVVVEWRLVALFTSIVLLGKTVGVAIGAFVTGRGVQLAVRAAMSLAQVGEFSFLLAGLALPLGQRGRVLVSVTAAVSALTTLLTPAMIGISGQVASRIDRGLPPRLQTFASLYGSWTDRLGRGSLRPERLARRVARRLAVDVLVLITITLATSRWIDESTAAITRVLHLHAAPSHGLVVVLALLLATPFVLGIGRLSRRLGLALASEALPPVPTGELDLSQAPRRLLATTFQLVALLLSGVPLVGIGHALFSSATTTLVASGVLTATVFFVARSLWRGAADVDGHVRAGTEAVLAALVRSRQPDELATHEAPLEAVSPLLPGLGAPVPLRLVEGSAAVGRTLGEIDLRGKTGATVLAIRRGEAGVIAPGATERLLSEDELLCAGSSDAIDAARELLHAARAKSDR